jgi:uncharacterized SAM-binding protein YcdF (DUF218 family)
LKPVFVDTNLFLRYLTNDIPDQADRVESLLKEASEGGTTLATGSLVIAELVRYHRYHPSMRTHVWPKFARAGIRVLRVALPLWSAVALVPLLLAFTSVPGKMHRWLAATPFQLQEAPEFVVLLGGEGIPSSSGLLRAYYAAEQAREHAAAKIVVALPSDPADEDSDIVRTKRELVLRGVSPDRIWFEPKGRNTREQALKVADLAGDGYSRRRFLLVTSPHHMRRALLTFRKAGFSEVAGISAFDTAQPVELRYRSEDLGGRRIPVAPDVGSSLFLRYGFWTNLRLEVRVASELMALVYYWIRGWI